MCRSMCWRWTISSCTWSQQTSEYLLIWSQSKVKACSHSWCCCSWWSTWDGSSYCLLNQPGDRDERPWSLSSLPNEMLHEWCSDWWILKDSGTFYQLDHACHSGSKLYWCHPPNNCSFKVNQSHLLSYLVALPWKCLHHPQIFPSWMHLSHHISLPSMSTP